MSELKVEFLGQRMVLSSPKGEEYLRELASFVANKLQEHTKLYPDTLKAVLSACVDIAEELFSEREKLIKLEEELGRRIDSMIKEIESDG
ncbi:MAG: cell division protein ZapA [Candidatus Aminicenantes bacterium]|nr:cell division protein ZapA [Candidatus Aminicenantes bacterium]